MNAVYCIYKSGPEGSFQKPQGVAGLLELEVEPVLQNTNCLYQLQLVVVLPHQYLLVVYALLAASLH